MYLEFFQKKNRKVLCGLLQLSSLCIPGFTWQLPDGSQRPFAIYGQLLFFLYSLIYIKRIFNSETISFPESVSYHLAFFISNNHEPVLLISLLLYCLYLMIRASWNPDWLEVVYDSILDKLKNPKIIGVIIISCVLGIINGINFILWIPEISEPVTQAYYFRLEPIIFWGIFLCGITLAQVNLLHFRHYSEKEKTSHKLVATFLGIFGIG